MAVIHVDEESLNALKTALLDAGESYKANVAKLTGLIDEITRGDIQGDPANELLLKYQAKEDTLRKLADTIDEAEGYLGIKTKSFTGMIGDLRSGMK